MVPEPSTRSPPIPFIGAETEWEVPYMAGQGGTGEGAIAVARPRGGSGRRARYQNAEVGGDVMGYWMEAKGKDSEATMQVALGQLRAVDVSFACS
jgi:hypothetical protein